MLVPYSGAFGWGCLDSVTSTTPGVVAGGKSQPRRMLAEKDLEAWLVGLAMQISGAYCWYDNGPKSRKKWEGRELHSFEPNPCTTCDGP